MLASMLWLIPAGPLVAALVIAFFGPKFLGEKSHLPCVAGIGLSVVISVFVFLGRPVDATQVLYDWISVGGLSVPIVLRADALTAIMLVTVTSVSLLVAIFASGYMHGDPGYPRFFAEIALFVFSMTMLVLAGNFLLLFVFWEAVGLCSYLLIGFWFRKPSAAAAAKKAFLVNRIGDFGFILGVFMVWVHFGSLNFQETLFDPTAIAHVAETTPAALLAICLLLFMGACGKSAQFPLHVWLPDAMEGPTPVSALIHAATMVTAGVYMVARCTPFFIHAPEAQLVVAGIGGFTALLAGLIALTQHDLKRVLAYSTVSQLGYMFLALGSAASNPDMANFAVMAAIFHLFTHAFFKALLFLGAGSVMHAMGNVIDMRQFGGLRKLMPTTHWTFLVGSVALAGIFPLSGFWSKDDILASLATASEHGPHRAYFGLLYTVGLVTSFLTAFYTFRAYFRTFWGAERIPHEAGHHAHESPSAMLFPLIVLACFAAGIGLVVGPTGLFNWYLQKSGSMPPSEHAHHFHWGVAAMSTLMALAGVGLAAVLYLRWTGLLNQWTVTVRHWTNLSANKFYIDEIYQALIVRPLEFFADLAYAIDQYGIDLLVDAVGWLTYRLGRFLRPIESGLVQSYALITFLGLAALLAAALRTMGG